MIFKVCAKCKVRKSITEFSPIKDGRACGVVSYCLQCKREHLRAYYQTDRYKEWMREYGKKRYQKDKARNLVRAKTRSYVKTGLLVKPEVCENCQENIRLEAHHTDYDKPLEVMWLCNLCHKQQHGRIKDKSLIKKVKP